MTHPIFTAATLEALTIAELKTIANQIGAIPEGDKRIKQTWVSAVIDHQAMFSPVKVEAIAAHIESVINRSESVTLDASELPSESPAIDNYVYTPDDEAYAAAMGLTYDDVFGEPASEPTPQLPPQRMGASIVALVMVLAFSVGVLAIKAGVTSIAWVIAALSPLVLGLWGYLLPDSKSGESVDYFPSAIA